MPSCQCHLELHTLTRWTGNAEWLELLPPADAPNAGAAADADAPNAGAAADADAPNAAAAADAPNAAAPNAAATAARVKGGGLMRLLLLLTSCPI
jgi:hypothetical protein